jgi:hypothetical protein
MGMAVRQRFGHLGRDAVRAFIARSAAEWLIEKNGRLSPHALRCKRELATMPMAA